MGSKDLLKNKLNSRLHLQILVTLTTQKNSASFFENLSQEGFTISVSVIISLPKDCFSRRFLTYPPRACVHSMSEFSTHVHFNVECSSVGLK